MRVNGKGISRLKKMHHQIKEKMKLKAKKVIKRKGARGKNKTSYRITSAPAQLAYMHTEEEKNNPRPTIMKTCSEPPSACALMNGSRKNAHRKGLLATPSHLTFMTGGSASSTLGAPATAANVVIVMATTTRALFVALPSISFALAAGRRYHITATTN